jgi:nicotinate-nucleotide pyrophosphorylase (carboxylating)
VRRLLGTFDAAPPTREQLDDVIERALTEDRAREDRSTPPLPGASLVRRAEVVAREGGVLAGATVFQRTFERLAGSGPLAMSGLADGDAFATGDVVLRVTAPGTVLLAGERTALNFLQRLSGVATVTRRCVEAVGGRVAVCDTRKTTPGLRALEKWAVVAGGGTSHRWSLGDMVMLKENHLEIAGGVGPAIAAIRADPLSRRLPITVEVTSFELALEAAAQGVDRLLLDNLSPSEMARIVRALGSAPRPELEASGGIGPDGLAAVAETGVDLVSLGALTHSVRAVDFSFLVRPGSP